jgi:serine phosphatase RsbU (regulator of sigma subunit)
VTTLRREAPESLFTRRERLAKVLRWQAQAARHDDITLIVMKVK